MKVSADPKPSQIHMVDLVTQYQEIAPEISEAFDRIIHSATFIGGPEVESFQQALSEYLHSPSVIACANGTDALQIALMALDLKPGDEVIVPAFTFIASAEVIALLGLTPVACDVDRETFNLQTAQLEALITDRTRVILPVHLFGQCCDMQSLMDIATKHNLYVVEDNAQSVGAQYKFKDGTVRSAGTMGTIGTLSFYPSKNLGCYGDGGAIYTNDTTLGAYIKSICNHGMTRRYYHDHIGVNSRLDAFQAAVLNIKLRRLNNYNAKRIAAAEQYDDLLRTIEEVKIPGRVPNSTHVFHQYTIRVPKPSRDGLQEYLKSKGIPTMIYYPVPMQDQKAFQGKIKTPVSLDVTNELCQTVLSLPMHSELDAGQVEFIAEHIRAFFAA